MCPDSAQPPDAKEIPEPQPAFRFPRRCVRCLSPVADTRDLTCPVILFDRQSEKAYVHRDMEVTIHGIPYCADHLPEGDGKTTLSPALLQRVRRLALLGAALVAVLLGLTAELGDFSLGQGWTSGIVLLVIFGAVYVGLWFLSQTILRRWVTLSAGDLSGIASLPGVRAQVIFLYEPLDEGGIDYDQDNPFVTEIQFDNTGYAELFSRANDLENV